MKLKKKINVIAVMGPDGSGKTFFINYLIKKLKIKNIIIKRIHLKPALINSNIKNVSNPHSKKPRNVLFSILKLLYWLLTYYLFGLLKYFPNKKKIYIFDRYVHDVLVDPLRYRVKLNFIIKFIINFFPKPDIWLFMSPNIKTIWSRKREIKYDTLSKQLISYKKLKKKLSNSFFISNKFDFIEILNVIKKKIKL
jgi:thymidylate kinase